MIVVSVTSSLLQSTLGSRYPNCLDTENKFYPNCSDTEEGLDNRTDMFGYRDPCFVFKKLSKVEKIQGFDGLIIKSSKTNAEPPSLA